MSVEPVDDLALKAIEQRHQLHERAEELKGKIQVTRERLDIKRNARERFTSAAVVVAAVGLLTGFATGGMFRLR